MNIAHMMVLYDMIYHSSPGSREAAADTDMDDETVRTIQRNARGIVSWFMVRASAILQVGRGRGRGG